MGQSNIHSLIQDYVNTELPIGSRIEMKAVAGNNLNLTLKWQGKKSSCYVICGPTGCSSEVIRKQLDYLRDRIPGAAAIMAEQKGYSKAVIDHLKKQASEQASQEAAGPTKFSKPKVAKEAKKFMLKVLDYPYTDAQIESFVSFTIAIAEQVLNNGIEGYDLKLNVLVDSFDIPKKTDVILDVHQVLDIMTPAQFAYWMSKVFGITMNKGMSYKNGHFYYE